MSKTALTEATQRLNEMCEKNGTYVVAQADQLHFMRSNPGLKMMIDGLEKYCSEAVAACDSKVGDDGFLGDYALDIARGILGLLNGPGKFDGGTLDMAVRLICERNNIELE